MKKILAELKAARCPACVVGSGGASVGYLARTRTPAPTRTRDPPSRQLPPRRGAESPAAGCAINSPPSADRHTARPRTTFSSGRASPSPSPGKSSATSKREETHHPRPRFFFFSAHFFAIFVLYSAGLAGTLACHRRGEPDGAKRAATAGAERRLLPHVQPARAGAPRRRRLKLGRRVPRALSASRPPSPPAALSAVAESESLRPPGARLRRVCVCPLPRRTSRGCSSQTSLWGGSHPRPGGTPPRPRPSGSWWRARTPRPGPGPGAGGPPRDRKSVV